MTSKYTASIGVHSETDLERDLDGLSLRRQHSLAGESRRVD